jgi:hypothetical protein
MKPDDCVQPDCPNASYARGLCQRHYRQAYRGKLGRTRPKAPNGEASVRVVVRLSPATAAKLAEASAENATSPSIFAARLVERALE